jgi:RNA polymerase sigma-70 factor (ECF subfamily)
MSDRETLDGPRLASSPSPSTPFEVDAELAGELRRFVLGVVRDPELADDVIQATYVKVLERGHEARPESARGWLFRVAFHEALAAKRRMATRDRNYRRFAGLGSDRDPNSPDAPLIRAEVVEAVREALDRLPEEQRRVVLARIYEEKTFAEIAGESNLPLGTVLTRMRRALEKMRRTLKPGG